MMLQRHAVCLPHASQFFYKEHVPVTNGGLRPNACKDALRQYHAPFVQMVQEHLATVVQHACEEHCFPIRTLTCRVRTLVSGDWTVS